MPTWLIFSLLSVTVLAGSEISQKISLSQKVDISAITNNFFVWTLQGIIGIVLALVLKQFSLDLSSTSIYKLLAISIVYFAGGTFFYTSYKGNSPSISIILGTISVVVSSCLGKVFLHETYGGLHIVGIALILSAVFFLNIKKKERLEKYSYFAILGGLCYGVAYTTDKSMVTEMSPFMYLGLMCLGVAIVSVITSHKLIIKETRRMVAKNYIPIISSAIFWSAFNLFTFFAYVNNANVGIADGINNTTVFFVILLEIFLLKDRSNLLKKLLCAMVATSGVILIGIS